MAQTVPAVQKKKESVKSAAVKVSPKASAAIPLQSTVPVAQKVSAVQKKKEPFKPAAEKASPKALAVVPLKATVPVTQKVSAVQKKTEPFKPAAVKATPKASAVSQAAKAPALPRGFLEPQSGTNTSATSELSLRSLTILFNVFLNSAKTTSSF